MHHHARARHAVLALSTLAALVGSAWAETPVYILDDITVTAPRPLFSSLARGAYTPAPLTPDVAAALEAAPGAAVVRNGPLTGIVQVRGLAGDRVAVRVDGMRITPACPNHMDPPLHYLSALELDSLTLTPASPTSSGGDSLGGSVAAVSTRPAFSPDETWRTTGKLVGGYNGGSDGKELGLRVASGGRGTALAYTGSLAEANDLRFPGGRVRDTGYSTTRHKLSLTQRTAATGELQADVGTHRTRDAGTPALPMDMVEDDAKWLNLAWKGRLGDTRLNARVYRHDIDHLMDNYSQRPSVGTTMFAPAESRDTGLALEASQGQAGGSLKYGLEAHHNDFDAYQQLRGAATPNRDILRDAERRRLGLFGEWEGMLGTNWKANVGLRAEHVRMDTGNVLFSTGAGADAAAFNAQPHRRGDDNWDWSTLFQYLSSPNLSYELGLSRKTRSPSLLERYEWTPLNASAGQADGRTYFGNLNLKPEVAHTFNAGLKWKPGAWQVRPAVFYQRVRDYIQGTPCVAGGYSDCGVRNDSNGQPVLKYWNFDSKLYGTEMAIEYAPQGAWSFSGQVSYVHGRNLDTDDNLYRIAPLQGQVTAHYRRGDWNHGVTARFAAAQDRVAAYNGEPASDGYAVWDYLGEWKAGKATLVRFGIENLLDKRYYDHLGGINRVSASNVALNARLPGAGRHAYLSLAVDF
jgi:iron complex outermembrane receptor protein